MLRIELLKRVDADQVMTWGTHEDPRLYHYDFSKMDHEDVAYWYHLKQRRLWRKIYGCLDENGVLVGFLTLKRINPLLKKAHIGVVFDPNVVNRGYGTMAVKQLAELVFRETALRRLYLEVADFNIRAIRCYEKSGFVKIRSYQRPYEFQGANADILTKDSSFYLMGSRLFTTIHLMCLCKDS